MSQLMSKIEPRVRLDWLPANGLGNIKRNAHKLIALARDRLDVGAGCVAVVVDRDRRDPAKDEPHRTIARACRRGRVELITAREAIEAWFLADPGICAWLGVAPAPETDAIPDPKQRVAQAFARKTGRPYRKRRARLEVVRHARGIDALRSRSARHALDAVRQCLRSD
jgi:hypothetical protein